MPARRVEDAIAPFKGQLGNVPDQQIAAEAGVSRSVVVNYRKKLGIPAYEGYKFGVRDAAHSSEPQPQPVAAKAAHNPKAVRNAGAKPAPVAIARRAPQENDDAPTKAFRGRRSRLDAFVDQLGKVPDSEIARLAGVTQENVRTFRMRRAIAPHRAIEAPTAKPAARPSPKEAAPAAASVFLVQLETAPGARSFAVVAANIEEAVAAAKRGVEARHPSAVIRGVQFVAPLI